MICERNLPHENHHSASADGSFGSLWAIRDARKAYAVQASIPTVDEPAANPERLAELRKQCKTDRPRLGDVLCNRVAEATRKRFYGDGNVPYTPPKEPPKF